MPDFRVFPGDYDDILDRSPHKDGVERAYFRERKLTQAAEINEQFSHQDNKRTRVGNLVASDGDRVLGCDIRTTDYDTGTYDLDGGKIYVRGDVRDVPAAQLTGVPTTGDVLIGVRIATEFVDHEDDPDYLGQYVGAASEGEAGAIRVKYTLSWGWVGDGGSGDIYAVYTMRDGYVVDQTPPPDLSGVNQQIAVYDYGAHENYIDEGCNVSALGENASGEQVFSIAEGVANILGYKRSRHTATRYSELEVPEFETVAAEAHTYVDNGGEAVINVAHTPINGLNSIIIEKEFSETITRGGTANTADALSKTSVTEITSVTQGSGPPTVFDETDDWIKSGDTIDWSPAGDEPATSSSYDVTYQYLEAVTPTEITDTSITVTGGVDGGQVLVAYTFKLPRIDRICLDQYGAVVYLKGLSNREQPLPPVTPKYLLSLCEVHNTWVGKPTIINNGIRNYPFWMIDRMYNRILDLLDLTSLERLRRDINAREPTAKHEVFVDPFTSDRYRDAGEAQDAAVFQGSCQIAIDPTFHEISLNAPVTLDYTDQTIINQDYVTECWKINPYQAFAPLGLTVTLTPNEDFWEETETNTLSPITQVFGNANQNRTTTEVVEDISTEEARFLRQINVTFNISGLGNGEAVDIMTFDGVDVDPGGVSGDVNGLATGNFDIPAGVAVGVKEFYVHTAANSEGWARFEGRGTVTTVTRQEITTIEQAPPPDVVEPEDPVNPDPEPEGTRRRRRRRDPLAQTFMLNENRHISGLSVKFCALGDTSKPVWLEIVTVENGIPTENIVAHAEQNMNAITLNNWTKISFPTPVFIPADREYAFVLKTDDASHSVSVAGRGGFDQTRQEYVGAQPYTIGVLLSSSNAATWTAHQDYDLTMRVHAAVFSPIQKVFTIGTIAVTSMTDIVVAANTSLPTNQAQLRFRITPTGESPQIVEPGQNWERHIAFTGNVLIEAVLDGTSKISPILGRNILAIPGTMRASGTYVSRVFAMGTAVRQDVRLKSRIPAGSTLLVDVDEGDDNWQALTLMETEILTNGDYDRRYTIDPFTAASGGRVRIRLTGTPAARPSVSDLRAFSI